ncbi:HAD family hydrolase [Spirochaeta dissipatitropha]
MTGKLSRMHIAPGRPPALAFDFDGTIADTRDIIVTSYKHAFSKVGLACPDDNTIAATIGIPLRSSFELLSNAESSHIDAAVLAYQDFYREQGYGMVRLFDGMSELLHDCRTAGYRMAIATSRRGESLDGMLSHLGIGGLFEHHLTRDHVSNEKPHPEMLQRLAVLMEIDTSSFLMIGDTVYDIGMGKAAGAEACAVTWGNHDREKLAASGADYITEDIAGLRRLLLAD